MMKLNNCYDEDDMYVCALSGNGEVIAANYQGSFSFVLEILGSVGRRFLLVSSFLLLLFWLNIISLS